MSRLPREARTLAEPGPECICGSELRTVPLPPDLAALAASPDLLVHVESGDTRCYPDDPDAGCYAEEYKP